MKEKDVLIPAEKLIFCLFGKFCRVFIDRTYDE